MSLIKALKNTYHLLFILLITTLLNACAMHQHRTVYEQVGGQAGIEKISDEFIDEIQYDKQILAFFWILILIASGKNSSNTFVFI
jgi:hypothetical protein